MKPCGRVVVDTNYFRGLREQDIEQLRARGFRVSVSQSAFYEAWAAAARDKDPGIIIGPSRNFGRVVDLDYPIAPTAGDLFWRFRVERRQRDDNRVRARYAAWATLNWQLAVSGNIDETAMLRVGQEADEYLRKRGQSWQLYARPWKVTIDAKCSPDERAELEAANAKTREQLEIFKALKHRKRHALFVAFASRRLYASNRLGAKMATLGNEVVLFGGSIGMYPVRPLNDTWRRFRRPMTRSTRRLR